MDDRDPWPRPAVPRTVVVYQDGGMADAILAGRLLGLALAVPVFVVTFLVVAAVRLAPLVARLAIAGTRALHAAAAGRLLDEPGPTAPPGREAVRC